MKEKEELEHKINSLYNYYIEMIIADFSLFLHQRKYYYAEGADLCI